MAIKTQDYPNTIEPGLMANKTFDKFFYRFKKEGKMFRGLFNYTNKSWDKRTRLTQAKLDFIAIKLKDTIIGMDFKDTSTLDRVALVYFNKAVSETKWNKELYDVYKLYVSPCIGKKEIRDIRRVHLDNIKNNMEKQGVDPLGRTKDGCSPRTIKKVLIESLKPILLYAVKNKVLSELPDFPTIKQTKEKKYVENADVKFIALNTAINELYKDDPFYRGIFLFALHARRWNEIATLEWNDIDLLDNSYTIRKENNKINIDQTYDLLPGIAQAINELKDKEEGLVFKSPRTGKKLHSPKKQLDKIKELVHIPELTMHYFRHIFASYFASKPNITPTMLAYALGHNNPNTVMEYYVTPQVQESSVRMNKEILSNLNNTLLLDQNLPIKQFI